MRCAVRGICSPFHQEIIVVVVVVIVVIIIIIIIIIIMFLLSLQGLRQVLAQKLFCFKGSLNNH